ncbi:MAG TPA: hypothetical protein VFN13_12430 [Rudaea sp.]|nr:hypothetical protein [Rudaea sp.]
MWRALGWLGIAALAAYAHWTHSDLWRAASAFAAILFIGAIAPRALRAAVGLLGLVALCLLAFTGTDTLLASLPALICAFVAWLFARTLVARRRPLIARAIAHIDGEAQLDDPQVAHYARRLTWIWALWQAALAVFGALVALHANGALSALPAQFPGPAQFGVVILPLAVAALFLVEFFLRPRLLPQAPHQSLWKFSSGLVRAWPRLLGD